LQLLHKFVTGIAFTPSDWQWRWAPPLVKKRLSNRLIDCSIKKEQIVRIPMPELLALYQLQRKKMAEDVLYVRNKKFQEQMPFNLLNDVDAIVGFDTSSWILAERAQRLGKPLFLDQSIAHPREKDLIYRELKKKYPGWEDDIPVKETLQLQHEDLEHKLSTRIIVASTFTRDSLIKQGLSVDKIVVNPYGVGQEFFRAHKKVKGTRIRFLYLGLLGARKGLPDLLEVWQENELYDKAELWLAGPASDFAIQVVNKTPGVTYKGKLPFNQIPDLLDQCDCLVFPSHFEGFGQVILEAMAAGLPVITTNATAGPDIIETGVDGFVIPAGNKNNLTRAMINLINDRQLSFDMGIRAQSKAKQFTWNAYGDRWREIICSI
jgi:starch synthase